MIKCISVVNFQQPFLLSSVSHDWRSRNTPMFKTVMQLILFVETILIFNDYSMNRKGWKERYLFKINIFCTILKMSLRSLLVNLMCSCLMKYLFLKKKKDCPQTFEQLWTYEIHKNESGFWNISRVSHLILLHGWLSHISTQIRKSQP